LILSQKQVHENSYPMPVRILRTTGPQASCTSGSTERFAAAHEEEIETGKRSRERRRNSAYRRPPPLLDKNVEIGGCLRVGTLRNVSGTAGIRS